MNEICNLMKTNLKKKLSFSYQNLFRLFIIKKNNKIIFLCLFWHKNFIL